MILQRKMAKMSRASSLKGTLMEEERRRKMKQRGERDHRGRGVSRVARERKGGVSRAITKMPSPTLLFVPSSVIFDTVSLLHNPN